MVVATELASQHKVSPKCKILFNICFSCSSSSDFNALSSLVIAKLVFFHLDSYFLGSFYSFLIFFLLVFRMYR